jgi:eukaryotic-like serine/threonine-protein kinase
MTEPRRLGDRYELGEVLGYGGMAEVLRGRDIRLGRDVAVKTLRVDLARDPSFQARFRREAQSAASLNHPAIVAVYDTGESTLDGVTVPYIVMEYVDGRTLRDVLKTERHIMPTRALEITAEVLKALDYSHRNGIIHRDIKPGNVMLNRAGEVKVMDFGIARALAQSSAAVTQTAAVIGTAQYLSPEQARGEQVDPRSDVYSAGCLLYELLTGTPPFTGDSAVAVAYQHVREDPIPPSRVNSDVSTAIDAIVLKAMAKNPANRYQSAAEMREDIDRALAGAPVQATPILGDQTVSLAAIEEQGAVRRQPRGRRTLTYIMLFLLAVALFIGLGLLIRHALVNKQTATDAPVPYVIGMTKDQAVQTLTNAHFNPQVNEQPNGKVAKGTVFAENPPQGSPLPLHSTVTITVSTGPADVKVPDLTGKLLADAKTELQQSQLVLGTTTPQDSQLPPGTVLSQTPGPGQTASSGSAVNVVVASGNGKVPDVRGLPVDQAEQELTQAGYAWHVTQQPDPNVTPGNVIQQSPNHDSTAKIGSTVELYVATAPPPSAPPTTTPPSSPTPTASSPSPPASTPAKK